MAQKTHTPHLEQRSVFVSLVSSVGTLSPLWLQVLFFVVVGEDRSSWFWGRGAQPRTAIYPQGKSQQFQ